MHEYFCTSLTLFRVPAVYLQAELEPDTMKTLLSQTMQSYRLGYLFCFAAFPLFCIPVFFEGMQHLAEVRLGMFSDNRDEIFDTQAQKIRLIFGAMKVLSLMAVSFLVPRYFLHGRDIKKTVRFSSSAIRAIVLGATLMAFAIIWVFLIGPKIVESVLPSATPKQTVLIPLLFIFLLGLPLQNKMSHWMGNLFDDKPLQSDEAKSVNKAMKGGLSLVFLMSVLPLMAVHYGLNIIAMGQSNAGLIMLLSFDSLVVGLLGVLLGASTYVIWRDARMP